jgi:hypothetical protein
VGLIAFGLVNWAAAKVGLRGRLFSLVNGFPDTPTPARKIRNVPRDLPV